MFIFTWMSDDDKERITDLQPVMSSPSSSSSSSAAEDRDFETIAGTSLRKVD